MLATPFTLENKQHLLVMAFNKPGLTPLGASSSFCWIYRVPYWSLRHKEALDIQLQLIVKQVLTTVLSSSLTTSFANTHPYLSKKNKSPVCLGKFWNQVFLGQSVIGARLGFRSQTKPRSPPEAPPPKELPLAAFAPCNTLTPGFKILKTPIPRTHEINSMKSFSGNVFLFLSFPTVVKVSLHPFTAWLSWVLKVSSSSTAAAGSS